MNTEIENLQSTIKKTYSFKYKPEFSESFTTEITDNQIIPLTIAVFEQLEWPIVFTNKYSVEAKRKNGWNKLTEKITIQKKASGRIEVHSKTIEGNFIDFGKNSKRTGLFIALFQKLAAEYGENGKLIALATAYEKQNSWADYEVPLELPKPKVFSEPNLTLTIVGGLAIAILFGVLIGFLSHNFTYFIGIYELGIGIGIGYFFGQVLKETNYIEMRQIQWMVAGIMITMFLTNLFTQYQLIIAENNISDLGFSEFIQLRLEGGLTIKDLDTGWIGLALSWVFQMVFPYFLAVARVAAISANFVIEKIPEQVLEYTIYLFKMEKSESEVRAELSQKGWRKRSDQDSIFEALGTLSGFQEYNRE